MREESVPYLDELPSKVYTKFCVLMGDRPAAGQRSLEPLTVVRIHVPQRIHSLERLSLMEGAFFFVGFENGTKSAIFCVFFWRTAQ